MNCPLDGPVRRVLWLVFALTGMTACRQVRKKTSPDEHRYRKVVLAEGLTNPIGLDFDTANRIYIAEMSGDLLIFDQRTAQLKHAGFLPTYDGGEFGITGMRLDPHFEKNGFIYLHYFKKDTARMECISRFTMQDDSLDPATEKRYLEFRHDNTCCHTAGGMAFDRDGNLYVATGDNSDAFFTHYALTDDRPGHVFNDALRSAGNTNDYRGKILRIHPEPDGSYTIPRGNLFPPGTDSTRPEIYVMGNRNPYRITIDPQTNYLYWGEVGPDADKDSTRGSRGYDEFNCAKKAGYFGWPLFIGNNRPYNRVYFEDGERIGAPFDTANPVNFSRNNTGLYHLPPPQPAVIWYPYDSSDVFPSFGTGGRTAIGGPIYHYDPDLDSKVKFPAYFDHCWFIADWMRNWIKVAHLDDHGTRGDIEDFMPHTLFKKPIFMQFGRDGALYLLEFGSAWRDNTDTKLVRIEYISGNRPPVARMQPDQAFGKAPLTVHFSADSSVDYDGDALEYTWQNSADSILGKGAHAAVTFAQPGKYPVKLVVKDANGATARRDTLIQVGNAMPEVTIDVPNRSFYRDTIRYAVRVADAEDGMLGKGISAADVHTTLRYLPPGSSLSLNGAAVHSPGEVLMNESDCKSCHQMNRKSVGPSFEEVAAKYGGKASEIPRLAEKILKGGSGVWGSSSMSPHPQLNMDQTTEIVKYIYSLAAGKGAVQEVSPQGAVSAGDAAGKNGGHYILQASYTDKGGAPIGPLTQQSTVVLRSPLIAAKDFDRIYDSKVAGDALAGIHNSHAMIRQVDFTGIRRIVLSARGSGGIAVRLDSVNGRQIGAIHFEGHPEPLFPVSLPPLKGVHDVYLVFVNPQNRFTGISLKWVRFDDNAERPL
ncbi:PQQ-dependent sugar dehydrogenase [Compostibacter hankyongensis]|uniref:Cytochrome c domain-containing protein n=1 Tax=Compostibacter hankyongensis TaxID=1007089 RepID=A0ABP8G2P9_9BACT